jgi:hypothetical protein
MDLLTPTATMQESLVLQKNPLLSQWIDFSLYLAIAVLLVAVGYLTLRCLQRYSAFFHREQLILAGPGTDLRAGPGIGDPGYRLQ